MQLGLRIMLYTLGAKRAVIGGEKNKPDAIEALRLVDGFLTGILSVLQDDVLLLVVSDHGNLEDLSHTHHTVHQVPTFIIGNARHEFAEGLHNLTHLTPAILRMLNINAESLNR